MSPTPQIQGLEIPADRFAAPGDFLGAATDAGLLGQHLDEHGYVLLRGGLDVEEVQAARAEVFERLGEVGEITEPTLDGIATGQSRRPDPAEDGGAFWTGVNAGPALRKVTHGEGITRIMDAVLGEPSRRFDLVYLRPTMVGKATALHYDYPFFAGNAQPMFNAWIPFGDALIEEGPLVIVEGSNRFDDLIAPFLAVDYSADRTNDTVQQAAYEKSNETDPVTLVTDRRTRLLSTDFQAGDLVILNMFTLHGSLDNISPKNRVRLSCDVRFQPAAQPANDERYFGDNPKGSKGGGYADMRGAQPLR